MLLAGHLALGYLASIFLAGFLGAGPSETNLIIIVGIFASILPDLDVVYFYTKFKSLRYRKNVSHRNWISHAPILYLIVGLGIFLGFHGSFYSYLGIAFTLGGFSHFVADSFTYGIMWGWPITKKKFALLKAPEDSILFYRRNTSSIKYYRDLVTKVYMKSFTFYFEILVIVLALAFLFFG